MDIINELKEGITKTTKTAVKKSNEFVECTRMNFAISDLEESIDTKLQRIGQIVYDARRNDTDLSEEITTLCDQIDRDHEEIERLQENIIRIKKQKVCRQCGQKIASGSHYCPNCGGRTE